MKIYVIYDDKAKTYHTPFYQTNDETCLRTMTDMANNPELDTCKFAEDYTLFCLGEYEKNTGEILLSETRDTICRLHELKKE